MRCCRTPSACLRLTTRLFAGAVSTEADETRWVFTPEAPWQRGPHQLRVLTLLEDPSGNQVGRAFEMKPGTAADSRPEPEMVAIPFAVGTSR